MSGGIVVPLGEFRKALVAVRPFVHPKDKTGKFSMLRLAPSGVMHVMATDGYSGAIARVPIEERHTDDAGFIDLRLPDVASLLSVFRVLADDGEINDAALRIESDGCEVVFTDVSGFIDGDSLTLQMAASDMPDIRPLIRGRLHPSGHLHPEHPRFGLLPPQAKKLADAMRAYGTYSTFHGEPSRRAYDKDRLDALVTIGEHFAAILTMPATPPEEAHWRYRWARDFVGTGLAARWEVDVTDASPTSDSDEPIEGQETLSLDGADSHETDDVGGYTVRRLRAIHEDD